MRQRGAGAGFHHFGIGFAGVAMAFGLTLLTMAYAIRHISGCNINRDCRRRSRPCALGLREMLRRGADQIKVMANGGCVSPADELTSVQFTVAELRAAVEEVAAQGKNVMAHTYTAASMTNCLDTGVHTLEHGNFISSEVAERMARSGTFLVPTIATYELLATYGGSLGYPEYVIFKIEQPLKGAGVRRITGPTDSSRPRRAQRRGEASLAG